MWAKGRLEFQTRSHMKLIRRGIKASASIFRGVEWLVTNCLPFERTDVMRCAKDFWNVLWMFVLQCSFSSRYPHSGWLGGGQRIFGQSVTLAMRSRWFELFARCLKKGWNEVQQKSRTKVRKLWTKVTSLTATEHNACACRSQVDSVLCQMF